MHDSNVKDEQGWSDNITHSTGSKYLKVIKECIQDLYNDPDGYEVDPMKANGQDVQVKPFFYAQRRWNSDFRRPT